MPFKLSWEAWVYGLFSALIGGGAGAVSAAIGVNLLDAKDWNLSDHPGHLFALMGTCFVINGSISSFAYLAKSPLPQVETVTEVTKTAITPTATGVQATVTKQTTTSTDPPKGPTS